ncbi:MAG: LptA/OstA family protein [Elusimicrobiota bacterium]
MRRLIIILLLLSSSFLFASSGTFWKGKGQISANGDSLSILNKGEKIVLKGNVKIEKDGMKIYSKKANIFEKKGYFEASGKVKIQRKYAQGDYLEAYADELLYDVNKEMGTLKDVKSLEYTLAKDSNVFTMNGDEVIFFEKEKIVRAKGNVTMVRDSMEINAEGRSPLIVTADEAAFYEDKNYFEAFGNVHINRDYANGDYVDGYSDSFNFNNESQIGYMKKVSNIDYFVKKDTMIVNMVSDELELNDKLKLLTAIGNVEVSKDKGEFTMVGSQGVYNDEGGYVVFSDTPVVTQMHEKGKGVYKGEKIYFYPETNKLVIEKQVEINFYPTKETIKEQSIDNNMMQ